MTDRKSRKRKGDDGDAVPPRKVHQSSSPREAKHDDQEKDCAQCRKILSSTEIADTVLIMHVDIRTISPRIGTKTRKKKLEEREKKEKEKTRILEKICALRNTAGGCLMIYFEKMENTDTFLGIFDEMIDDRLHELIEDGTLFSESYLRKWHEDYDHVLCITCNSSAALSTVDYNTQMSLNKGLTRPTALNIRYLLSLEKPPIQYKKILLSDVQEQNNIQLKSFRQCDMSSGSSMAEETHLVDMAEYVLNKLRLKEYISAFANQKSGGHYFWGIAEKEQNTDSYHKKMVSVEGLSITKEEERTLQAEIRNRVKSELLWVDRNMKKHTKETIKNSIEIFFRKTEDNLSVMEVFVYPVEGVVFYDKSGPLSYKLSQNSELEKIDLDLWHKKILEITIPS